jgi:acetyl esterase
METPSWKPSLHPQTQVFLDRIYQAGRPQMHELSVPDARRAGREMHLTFGPPLPPGVTMRDLALERSSSEGGQLKGRLYRPAAVPSDKTLPALLWFHGGGWVLGDLDSCDGVCGELCLLANAAVLSVDYRLAPEHRFPAAVEDAAFSVRWLLRQDRMLAVNKARVAIGGDSAGGNLAIVASLMLRDAGEPGPCFQLLVYPATDSQAATPSRKAFGTGLYLTKETMRYFGERYFLRGRADAVDWRASPLLAPRLSGLPPALIIAAELDPLVDEGKAFADRLKTEGVSVEYTRYPGVIHGFFSFGRTFDAGRAAVQQAGAALARALA